MAGESTGKSAHSDNTPQKTPPVRRRRRTGPLRSLDLIYEVLNSREMTNNAMKLVGVLSVFLVIPLAGAAVALAAQHQQFAAVASMSTAGVALLSSAVSLFVGRKRGNGFADGDSRTPPGEGPGPSEGSG